MKRSEINNYIENFIGFCKQYNYRLPTFDYNSAEVVEELKARQLGFDITDYGSGDFSKIGLSLFTVRNGNPKEEMTIPYCEKTFFSLPGQKTPCHYHNLKTEDIFVRAGSPLIIKIWNFDPTSLGGYAGQAVVELEVLFNGCEKRVIKSGEEIRLKTGDSVTLTPVLAHEFMADPSGQGSLVGEVSTYNDDAGDNYFLDKVSRFPEIDEDEPIKHYLVGDYKNINS
jgi:D-lyxose ketol-isomerase